MWLPMIQIHRVESVFDRARTLHASPFSSVHQLFGQLLSIILAPVVLWQGEVFDANCFPRVTFLFGMLPFWCALCFGNVRFQHIFAPPTHESSAMHLTFARFCHVKYIPLHLSHAVCGLVCGLVFGANPVGLFSQCPQVPRASLPVSFDNPMCFLYSAVSPTLCVALSFFCEFIMSTDFFTLDCKYITDRTSPHITSWFTRYIS